MSDIASTDKEREPDADYIDTSVFVSPINREIPYALFVDGLFKIDTEQLELCHIAMGVSGEAGEFCDAIKKHTIYGKPLDRENVIEELGDLFFYMQAMLNKLDIPWEEVLASNVAKLGKRYPSGMYRGEDAIARADKEGTLT